MRKRIYLALAILLSLSSICVATYMAAQKAASQRAKAPAKNSSAQGRSSRRTPAQRGAANQASPIRAADPNRAPQSAVDDALYTNEEFFGTSASVMRPYNAALERVSALISKYPKDARLRLHAAKLSENLSQFDRAAREMEQYADLKGRRADALRRVADFYHHRARYADEVETLQELAKVLPVADRAAVYKRAAELVRSRSLKQFKPSDFFAELVAADPSNIQPIKNYVEELGLAAQYREALSVLASFQPKFPSELGYFLSTRARILEAMNDRRGAEEVYSSAFDPNWPRSTAADYYDLLRRFGRYRAVRRALQERFAAGASDMDTAARLFSFFAYEGNYAQAARVLAELEDRRAGRASSQAATAQSAQQPAQQPAQAVGQPSAVQAASWTAKEIETAAGMFASVGHYDQASRYLYTLYLMGELQSGSASREHSLYRLFRVMLDAAGTPTRVAAGDLSFYRDIAEVDQHPGFMNGVLSLVLSGTEPAYEFAAQQERAAGYFNRAFAYRIFTGFKQEYAQSQHMGEMYLGVVNVFASLGEHKLAIEAGREFQQRFPDSPHYAEVSLRIADSYVALKDRASERSVLGALLDRLAQRQPKGLPLVAASPKRWSYELTPQGEALIDRIRYNIEAYSDTYDPTQDSESDAGFDEGDEGDPQWPSAHQPSEAIGPSYSSVLERYVSSLAAEDKKTETVAFFWSEIKKHPSEEGLYERFLRWLGQAQIINEQLKAYNSAIKQFDSNTWYHRLARWYVRQKRGRELARYSRQLIDVFDEEEISDYLLRFAGYGATAGADELDWDQRLAFDLYSYAHTRFPRNLFFVRGMLTYLEKNDRARWEKLSAQYYFADRSIRDPYLAWLSRQGQLRDRYARARSQAESATATGGNQSLGTGFAYRVFAADAAVWVSHHDEAIDAYRHLVSLYPGERQYANRLSDLTRSFGQQDVKYYEESARVLAHMADIYPSDHSYSIEAGEVYAEMGDFERAAEQWNKLIAREPGDRETYLEVATVFWDYYQYDRAIAVFKSLREMTGDQNIYAYRLGAVYEGKGDMDAAIAEYVKVLSEPGDGRDTAAERLAQLSRRAGLADKIAAAYQSARQSRPADWQLIIGYASYQAERDKQADALALLRSEVAASNDVGFLETARSLFRSILRPEDEQQVLERLVAVARDERESMMYRLQLASFLERHNQKDRSISIIDKLVADYSTNAGVIEESAKFYWRAGQVDRSLDLYKRSLARARGANRRTLTLQYARRQLDAGKPADAEATLRAYYNENRSDTEVFAELARVLGAANKLAELAELYQSAFKDARESGLASDEVRARMVELRHGMIRTLTALGKHQEALDQHIEIINTLPEEADYLASAIEYAERHNLTERLISYYEKLAAESNKNYRWQMVLGRIYERRGNLAGASEQYRIAVVNEPQRSDLRFALASTLARQRRYDEAIATLREGWALAGRDPQWLIEVARIQIQQGRRDQAAQTMRQALASKQNATVQAQLDIASQLSNWGLHDESVRVYEQAFARLPKVLKDEYVSPESVTGYVRALVRSTPASAAFQKLEQLRGQLQAIAANSQDTDSYRAKSIIYVIDLIEASGFGSGVLDYASASDMLALASAIRDSAARLLTYDDREELQRYLAIARGANLVEVEEQIHRQLVEAAFKARTKPEDTGYYEQLRALVAFYDRHAAYARAAEALASEFARDPYKDRFDYQNQIAIQYRLAGDESRELQALRAAYRSASGDLTANRSDWVERYLSLLYSTNQRGELVGLASSYSPYQLQLINFLIEKNEKELAYNAIARSNQSPAWVASRSAEVGLYINDKTIDTEGFFKNALDLRPIGQLLERQPDPARMLVGDDWFITARNYGYWLGIVGRENDSRNLIVGEIESAPASASAQLELAAYYLDRKNAARAGEHTQLAAELAPGSKDVAVMQGAVALVRGDRNGALGAWRSLIEGRASVGDALRFLKVMADNGMLREALQPLENFMVALVNRAPRERREERTEAVKHIAQEIARLASRDARLASEAAAMFNSAVTRMPEDTSVGRMLIEEGLLPESSLASLYRTMHRRLSDMAQAVFGTAAYENGYWTGTDYFYPARELSDFRRRLADYLIRTRAYDEARLLFATIKQEQADAALALEEGDDSSSAEDRYDWLPLASALLELRAGRDTAKAVAELRRYCGLDSAEHAAAAGAGLHEKCLKAYALLVAEQKTAEADALLYDAYRASASSRYSDDASLAGLAEIEARRGRADEAARLLRLLVERATDNLNALRLAAETAARIGRYNDAAEFREQIERANPDDAQNRLELARVIAAAGRNADAINRIASLIADRATANRVRAQAAEVMGQIVSGDKSQAATALAALAQSGADTAGKSLASAAVAEALGRADEARTWLEQVQGPLAPVAQMKLGLMAAAMNRNGDAIANFQRAVYLDASGVMTDSILFRAPGPRAQLIVLYSRAGRHLAAIRMAEGVDSPRNPSGLSPVETPLSTAARNALLLSGGANQAPTAAFEPSLESARAATAAFRTIAELNDSARSQAQPALLAALSESASQLGQYDRAIALERLRASETTRAEERAAIQARLAQMIAAEEARRLRRALLPRFDRSNATASFYAARILGGEGY